MEVYFALLRTFRNNNNKNKLYSYFLQEKKKIVRVI